MTVAARLAGVGFVLGVAIAAGGCGGAGRVPRVVPAGPGNEVGVYRVRAEDADGRSRRFKLLLWAAEPDRVHGEVVTPVGTTALIFDGGGGVLAVTLVREGRAFVGPAEPAAMAGVLGVPIGLEQLVAGLLTGEAAEGEYRILRRPATRNGLPEWLEIRGPSAGLEFELKRRQALPASTTLGTGTPLPGLDIRPLDELRLHELPLGDEAQR